jgi:hypothetical protein
MHVLGRLLDEVATVSSGGGVAGMYRSVVGDMSVREFLLDFVPLLLVAILPPACATYRVLTTCRTRSAGASRSVTLAGADGRKNAVGHRAVRRRSFKR